MLKKIRSIAFSYGLPLLAYVLLLLLTLGVSRVFSFSLDLTLLIIALLIATSWFIGRNPGLLIAVLFEVTLLAFQTAPYTGRTVFISFNRLVLFVSLVLFASSRRKAEQKLSEQREILRVTISSIGDAVISTDLEGKINFINPTAESLTGWKSSEACGQPVEEVFKIVNEETRQTVENPFSAVMREGVTVGHANHTILIAKDGREIPIEDRGAPIKDPGGTIIGVIIVFHDVTERRQIEKERELLLTSERRARIEAENAGRLKDEFLATVSHELRTPLTAILGWSSILNRNKIEDETIAAACRTIERSATAQSKIVSDILDVSHIITGKLQLHTQVLRLAPIIQAAVETLQPAITAKSISLKQKLDENSGLVSGDPDRLQQIIWNLVSNAIKFTPSGGKIEIELSRTDSEVELKISDNGIGINPEFLPFVFDRFRQFDSSITRVQGGLGLGLSIVRHLVELHGGTVLAESEGDGKGAVFTVRLPMAELPALKTLPSETEFESAQAVESQTALIKPELQNLRVLVVDDDADTLEVLKFAFGELGADVRTADSSATAFETFLQGKFDVVVSDLGLPLEDGFTLIGKIRALSSEQGGTVPAVAVSGYVRQEDRDQALKAGFQIHVPKPVDPLELASIVDKLAKNHKS